MRKAIIKRRSAVGFISVKINLTSRKDNMVIIMKNNYFAIKAAMKKVNENVKKAHPDWDNKKVYAVTRSIVLK